MNKMDNAVMRLCLLTRAAWEEGLLPPLTRLMAHQLFDDAAAMTRLMAGKPSSPLEKRANLLLMRAERVKKVVDAYREKEYEILLPDEDGWPERLRRLRPSQRPHFLFVRGNTEILNEKAVAVAGSREILPYTSALARRAGQMIASEGLAMVCGGARGVDTAAQAGLLELGGKLILVPARPVKEFLERASYASVLKENRLLIMTDALPDEHFSAAKAIARNHIIYALAEAALVIAARDGVGGSWHGANDCLSDGYTPVFVPENLSADMTGNASLQKLGAGTVDLLKPLSGQILEKENEQLSLF